MVHRTLASKAGLWGSTGTYPHQLDSNGSKSLYRIVPHLRKILPSDAPPLESISVTVGHPTHEPDSAIFYNGYTKEKMFTLGGAANAGIPGKEWIRANRSRLREHMSRGVEIKWNKRFVKHEVVEERVKAYFEDGTEVVGDILVGADGISSPGDYSRLPIAFNTIVLTLASQSATPSSNQAHLSSITSRLASS